MQPDAPFLGAGMGSGDVIGIIPTLNATVFVAMTQEGKLNRGFETLYTEMERLRRYGFTQGEFERAQEDLMRQIERTLLRQPQRPSERHLRTELPEQLPRRTPPIPRCRDGVESSRQYARQDDQRRDGQRLRTADHHPEQPGYHRHGSSRRRASPPHGRRACWRSARKVTAADVQPYEDNVVKEPLIPEGTVKGLAGERKTVEIPRLGTTEWTLANGVKVVVKKTDFKADEVLMSAVAKGGLSQPPTREFYMGEMMPAINSMSGVGNSSPPRSSKKQALSGKTAGAAAVGNYSSTMSGSASPKDVETMLQLLLPPLHAAALLDRTTTTSSRCSARNWPMPRRPRLPDAGEDPGGASTGTIPAAGWYRTRSSTPSTSGDSPRRHLRQGTLTPGATVSSSS